jgi:hypothetical protein
MNACGGGLSAKTRRLLYFSEGRHQENHLGVKRVFAEN